MGEALTYGEFLALFLGVPLVVLGLLLREHLTRTLLLVLTIVSLVAVVYTGPWDSAIITRGVWSYGSGKVVGIVIGHVPLEEFLFYVLQVFLAGFVTAILLRREAH